MWEKAKKEGGGELRGLGVRLLEPAEAVQISLRGDTAASSKPGGLRS